MLQADRFSKYILVLFMVVSAALGLLRFNSLQLGASYDDAHYIILAESLSSGEGYELINFSRPQIERAFPPGWPILLAPLTSVFPGNYRVLKVYTLIIWLISLLLIYKLFMKKVESPYLEIIFGLLALNPLLVGMSVTVMSESSYLLFSLITLVLFDSQNDRLNYWLVILIALAALFTQLIRTIGISIFFALFLYLLFSRRIKESAITFGVFSFGALFQFWLNLRNGGSVISAGYESQVFNGSILEKIGQMWTNLLGYLNETIAGGLIPVFGERVTYILGSSIPWMANTGILLLVILGVLLSWKRVKLFDVYVLIYLVAILAFWNPKVGSVKVRFLIPMIPFLYFYLIGGMKWIFERVTKNHLITARLVFGVAVAVTLSLVARNVQDWLNPVNLQMTDLSIGTDWIAENAPKDAIVMVNEPVPAYVQAHRKTVGYPRDLQNIENYVVNQGIDYIVISPLLQTPRSTILDEGVEKQLLPILNSAPGKYTVVYRSDEHNVTVYRVVN